MLSEDNFNIYTNKSLDTITARVLADSVNPAGIRLTTMEWTYPRFIHAEIMTHRQLSRNSASSRAIPLQKMIERVMENPVFPLHWGKNQKGMQATAELSLEQKLLAAHDWLYARAEAVRYARRLEDIGLHKQIGNRLLEPWMWITVIVSATNFENLFALRCHPDAEPHFQYLADKARTALDCSLPKAINWGGWHLPLFGFVYDKFGNRIDIAGDEEVVQDSFGLYPQKISAARCARVSYLTHEGKRNVEEDIVLYERLASHRPMHASPLEHPAQAVEHGGRQPSNFHYTWLQFRKFHANECVSKRPESIFDKASESQKS